MHCSSALTMAAPPHLHLAHSSFSRRALHKLNKAAAFARRDFGVHDVPKAPKKQAEVVFSDACSRTTLIRSKQGQVLSTMQDGTSTATQLPVMQSSHLKKGHR